MAGALKIVGGAVTLDENGFSCATDSSGTISFGPSGMLIQDSSGSTFSAIRRVCMGLVTNGKYVKFSPQWETTPSVVVFPQTIVTADTSKEKTVQRLHCYADEITNRGFRVHCYEGIDVSNYSTVLNTVIMERTETVHRYIGDSSRRIGPWTSNISFDLPENSKEVTIYFNVAACPDYKYGNSSAPNFGLRDGNESYLTLYCGSSLIYSGCVTPNFYANNHNTVSTNFSTGILKLDGSNNHINGTFKVSPYINKPGDGSDTVWWKITVLRADGYRDTGTTSQYIDSNSNAFFLATDNSTLGYTVE